MFYKIKTAALFCLGLLGVVSLASESETGGGKTYTQQTLPAQIKRAVNFHASLKESHLNSDLKGFSKGDVLVDVEIETRDDFLVYADKLKIESALHPDVAGLKWNLEVLRWPEKSRFLDPVSKEIKEGYKGQITIPVRLSLDTSNDPQGVSLLKDAHARINVAFQSCNKEVCLLPAKIELDIPLFKTNTVAKPGHAWWDLHDLESLSFLTWMALFIAGLLTAFTPCVYPLYPITLGIFSSWASNAQKDATSKSAGQNRAFLISIVYCLGMSLTYACVGLIAVASGKLFGSFASNPFFLIGIGVVLLASAVFFSGFLNFPIPNGLLNLVTKQRSELGQLLQAFLMGAGLGVVAAPCVGPALVAILAWLSKAFSQGDADYFTGFLLLGTYGLGMSFPFLVLGHFIIRMGVEPRLGRYTPWIKNIGSLLMLAGALSFLVPGIQQLSLRFQQGNKNHTSTHTLAFDAENLESWDATKWAVVDFRADWCAACIELEHQTFPNPKVSKYFTQLGYQYVRVDLTEQNAVNDKITEQYNLVGLPSVLIYAPGKKLCTDQSLYGFEDAEKFSERLERAKTSQCTQ